jgi:hypothetical protein
LTGVGSVPGTSVTAWAGRIADQLPEFPHVPELPERGPGADMIGRTLGLLSEIAPDFTAATTVTGWELTRASRDMRRARSLLAEDLDAVEQAWQGHTGLAKQQLAGPYTIAAAVERKGRRLLADPGIVRDLVVAWREMADAHRRELTRRLAADWVLQMDEPSLPAVVAGAVSTISGMGAYPPIEPDLALGADLVHCCAPGLPFARCVAAAGCCSICHCTTRRRTSSWRSCPQTARCWVSGCRRFPVASGPCWTSSTERACIRPRC